jgi:LPXTG-motif cell wall-anchored protein
MERIVLHARRIVLVLSLVLVSIGAGPAVGAAPVYPPAGSGGLQVSASRLQPGEELEVAGSGFAAGGEVAVVVARSPATIEGGGGNTLSTLTATSEGEAATTIELPEGEWVVGLRGRDPSGDMRVLTTSVVVTDSASSGDGSERAAESKGDGSDSEAGAGSDSTLPKTGDDLTFLWAGLGLLVAGSALVAIARARWRLRN